MPRVVCPGSMPLTLARPKQENGPGKRDKTAGAADVVCGEVLKHGNEALITVAQAAAKVAHVKLRGGTVTASAARPRQSMATVCGAGGGAAPGHGSHVTLTAGGPLNPA